MPLLIPFLPALAGYIKHDGTIEGLFIGLIALTTLTIISGYRLHKSSRTLVFASIGFVLLVSSLFVGDNHGALILTSGIGAAFMLAAHYTNYKLCKSQTCHH